MPDITLAVGAAGAVIGMAGRSIRHISALVQTPEELKSAKRDIDACQKKLGELIELRKKHDEFLSCHPKELAAIEEAISTAWSDLQRAKPILERNIMDQQRAEGAGISRITRRIRWKVSDRNIYQFHEKTILRNQIEVREQISKLEHMVRLEPVLEKLEESSRESQQRLKEERFKTQETRDLKGLALLAPLVHEVEEPVLDSVVTTRSDVGPLVASPLSTAPTLPVAPVTVVSDPLSSDAAALRALSLVDDDEDYLAVPLAVQETQVSSVFAVPAHGTLKAQRGLVRRANFS